MPGASTFMTSAPMPASSLAQYGPDTPFAEVQGRDAAEEVLAHLHAIRRLPFAAPIVR